MHISEKLQKNLELQFLGFSMLAKGPKSLDTLLFNLWLKDFLLPALLPGQVVIMDNASFHKSQESQGLIEQAVCKVLFLPPYSPDLNPIEVFRAHFKKMIQNNLGKFKTLAEAIDFSFSTVRGWHV